MRASKLFTKVLIANRGEIACRIIAACRATGLRSVAVYSEADAGARHTRLADEAVLLGAGPVAESYLNIEKLLNAAKATGADAIHPGYGFLSENAAFAQAVTDAGLVWIGPTAETIRRMGNKIEAKKIATRAGVPTLPWALLEDGWKTDDLNRAAAKVGFPLLLKAAAGGGGRGMRLVEREGELEEKATAAVREAQGAFGSGEVFLERYCPVARHVEVQILGDTHGNVVTIGERECSVQRRHQKVIEEAPAPNLAAATRQGLWKAGLALARQVNYVNAGTCEFLVDADENFYFLEMNTRLQVEHPVTELVWGVDLPALQLAVAMGEPLSGELLDLERSPRGHAIEARLYAEDPAKGFMPAPGRLASFRVPALPQLRSDLGYDSGSEIPLYYDAMMAKVIAWGMSRENARRLLVDGVSRTLVQGVAWNGPYLVDVLEHPQFIQGTVNTGFLAKELGGWKAPVSALGKAMVVAASTTEAALDAGVAVAAKSAGPVSPWVAYGHADGRVGRAQGADELAARAAGETISRHAGGPLHADYPGKVLKISVSEGDAVEEGQTVLTCESMKMEYAYLAPLATRVKTIHVQEGQIISAGAVMISWDEA